MIITVDAPKTITFDFNKMKVSMEPGDKLILSIAGFAGDVEVVCGANHIKVTGSRSISAHF